MLETDSISYQGAQELAAYHIDRALGFNMKPATTGRLIGSEEMAVIAPYDPWG